jgi:hypothetical protein
MAFTQVTKPGIRYVEGIQVVPINTVSNKE